MGAARDGPALPPHNAKGAVRELCAALDDCVNVCPVLFGVWLFELAGAYHDDAMMTATQVLVQAQRTSNAGDLVAGNISEGVSRLHLGAVKRARSVLQRLLIAIAV